jgi:multidrug efflux pump subunit AcrA (membrane-fusion protein)
MKRVLQSLCGFGLMSLLAACGPPTRQVSQKAESASVSRVKAVAAVPKEGRQIYKASGMVRALITAPLAGKIMGTVLEVRVRTGDQVKAGQILVVIDGREAEAQVKKSKAGMQEAAMALQEIDKSLEAGRANLQLASSTLKRFQELADQKSISPQEFDEVQTRQRAAAASVEALEARRQQVLAKIQQAQSDVDSAQSMQSYTQLRAPMDGVVVQRLAEPGSLAVPGMPLLIEEDVGHYRLEVPVEESQINKVKVGESVPLRIDALSLPEFEGTVTEIQPSADPASRTYLVKITLPIRAGLRSGMYGEAYLPAGTTSGIWLPKPSIVREGQLEGVYVIDKDNVARLRLLKLGQASADTVEILAGLDGGEMVIVEGTNRVQDGSKVEVTE